MVPEKSDEKSEAAIESQETETASGDKPAPEGVEASAEKKPTSVAETPEELAASDEQWEGGKEEEAAKAEEKEADKGLSPEAIQKRLDALGGETDEDKASRLEEERLAERRKKARTGKKGKSGLQSAASKRLSDIGTKNTEKKKKRASSGLASRPATAADFEGDALLETAGKVNKWIKENAKLVGAVVGVAAVVGLVAFGSWYMQHKKEIAASTTLEEAVADETGRIGDPSKEDDDDRPKDTTPIFKTPQERQDAALAKFREVTAKYPGTGAAFLARLSEGSLLLDKHDFDGAIAAYNEVKDSPLAKVDVEVHGRALEGLGFAYEMKGDKDPNALNDALKTFKELENTDATGFQELGMYHQARVYEKQGDKDRAKELLKSVYERCTKPGENHPYPYLENLSEDRLRALDPTALPPKKAGTLGGPTGNQMSEAQMRQLIEQLKRQQAEHGGGGGGHP